MQYALNYSGAGFYFCPLKIKITQFLGGFPLYLTHCKNHWEFSIAFERYCSDVDLKYENFKWAIPENIHTQPRTASMF